jgi:hypothetical protein
MTIYLDNAAARLLGTKVWKVRQLVDQEELPLLVGGGGTGGRRTARPAGGGTWLVAGGRQLRGP